MSNKITDLPELPKGIKDAIKQLPHPQNPTNLPTAFYQYSKQNPQSQTKPPTHRHPRGSN